MSWGQGSPAISRCGRPKGPSDQAHRLPASTTTRESLRVPASPRPEAKPRALSPQVLGIHVNKWRLDRKLGMCVLALYAVFLCFSIMIEFNVFTFVNLPMCREDD